MTLHAIIRSMNFPAARPEITSKWLRRLIRLPPLGGQTVPLIASFDLMISQGEVLTVVGASASGKTTLLRILCGLETRFEGQVLLDEAPILKPQRRIYLMPQQHTLLDWFTVEQNLLFFARGDDDCDHRTTVDEILARLQLINKRYAYPITLSGGERARVALGCAMAAKWDVLLLDEPFRGLDQLTSERIQEEFLNWLMEMKRKEAVVIVIVSHSVADAVFLGDRVIVVRGGPLSVFHQISTKTCRERQSEEFRNVEADVFSSLKAAVANNSMQRTALRAAANAES